MLSTLLCALAFAACGGGSEDPQPQTATATATAQTSAPDVRPTETPTATAAAARKDRFDEDRACKQLEYQVNLGPRPAGLTRAQEARRGYIKARIPRGKYESVPGGLTNVVGEIPGKGKAIVLAAHYDTKDILDFVGA